MTLPGSPLDIADFRRFWFARAASVMATSGMVVIIGYQLYDLARGAYHMTIPAAALQLGLLGFAQFLPVVLLTPIAGVVADRFDRRIVAGCSSLLDCGVALSLAITTQLSLVTLPLLYLLAVLHGISRVFIVPAQSAIVPNIVSPELLPRAIAINSMAMQIGAVAGPALGGLLFALAPAVPYWTAATLLAFACVAVFGIRPVPPPPGNRDRHPLRQMTDGLRFVFSHRFLLGCVTLDLFAVLLGGATALIPVYARDILAVGPNGLGLMRAAPACGAAIVALALARWPLASNVGVKMLWAVAAYGAVTLAFGLSRSYPLSLALLAVLGGVDMVSVFIRTSLVQLHTPDSMRGRVSAISSLAISASNELGEMESGVAAALFGATGAVVFGGAGAIVITLLWGWLFPEIRRARTFAPHFQDKETPA